MITSAQKLAIVDRLLSTRKGTKALFDASKSKKPLIVAFTKAGRAAQLARSLQRRAA